tara:strand:+ start:770 stop:1039 length:270 start_codon:yes stop_codon:yes gene_type:complete
MDTKEKVLSESQTVLEKEHSLILFNDEENSFDFVIDVLCSVCEHSEDQAEQCAWITHYKGKCQVLSGSFEKLESKARLMSDVGLTVEIQ